MMRSLLSKRYRRRRAMRREVRALSRILEALRKCDISIHGGLCSLIRFEIPKKYKVECSKYKNNLRENSHTPDDIWWWEPYDWKVREEAINNRITALQLACAKL